MSVNNKKQHRDSILQKIYDLAEGRMNKSVYPEDLEKVTGLSNADLMNAVLYLRDKKLVSLGYVIGASKSERHRFVGLTPISLTADGIDYLENGFSTPTQAASVSYTNVFNDANSGPIQQGGSGNRQDTGIGVTSPASESTLALKAAFPELEDTDVMVLRAACEEAIKEGDGGNPFIYTEKLVADPLLSDVSAEELNEALQVLLDGHYIEPVGRRVRDVQVFTVTTFGFERYAHAFIEGYEAIVLSVIARIVNDGDRINKDIASALNQPLMVVNHILDILQQDQKLKQFKPLNTEAGFEIFDVSPLLKRMLR